MRGMGIFTAEDADDAEINRVLALSVLSDLCGEIRVAEHLTTVFKKDARPCRNPAAAFDYSAGGRPVAHPAAMMM